MEERRNYFKGPKPILSTLELIFYFLVILAIIFGIVIVSHPQILMQKKTCAPSRLIIGTNEFIIKEINPNKDGSVSLPIISFQNAYWVSNTKTNYLFGFSPSNSFIKDIKLLKIGDPITIQWQDCNSEKYFVSATLQPFSDWAALSDQNTSKITLFIPGSGNASGESISGELQEAIVNPGNQVQPNPSEVQAELSLTNTRFDSENSTLVISLSILNVGNSPITVTEKDIQLVNVDGMLISLKKSEPVLPLQISAKQTNDLILYYPWQSGNKATLRLLSLEFDITK